MSNSTTRQQETIAEIPFDFWSYGKGVEKHRVEVGAEDLKDFLTEATGDAGTAGEVVEALSGATSGVLGLGGLVAGLTGAVPIAIAGTVNALLGLFLTTPAVVIGVFAALAAGIVAIVQRVRNENGTNLAVYNTVPGMDIKVQTVSNFDGNVINMENGSTATVSVIRNKAIANCEQEKLAGFGLNLEPYDHGNGQRGGGQIKGVLGLKVIYKGKVYHIDLSLLNRIGAGIKSKYALSIGDQSWTVESNRAKDVSQKSVIIDNLFQMQIKLEHAEVNGKKDQRKDVVTLFFNEPSSQDSKSERITTNTTTNINNSYDVTIRFQNKAGIVPIFTVEYNGHIETINGRGSGWGETKTFRVKKSLKVTAKQKNGTVIKGGPIIFSRSTSTSITVKGSAGHAKME